MLLHNHENQGIQTSDVLLSLHFTYSQDDDMDLESFGKKKKKKKRGGLELADEEAEKDAGEFQFKFIIHI